MTRSIVRAATLVLTLLFSLSLLAQLPQHQHFASDPQHPLASIEDMSTGAITTSTFGGTLVFNFTITVKSTFPTGTTVYCRAGGTVFDSGTGRTWSEGATVAAVKGTTTTTCSVKIPYSWALATATAATDMVNLDYEVFAVTTVTTSQVGVARDTTSSLGSIKVPINGATTTTAIAATF